MSKETVLKERTSVFLDRVDVVSLHLSGAFKVKFEVAAKASAIAWKEALKDYEGLIERGVKKHVTAAEWVEKQLPRLKGRTGYGILDNLSKVSLLITISDLNKHVKSAFKSGNKNRLPDLEPPGRRIRLGCDVKVDFDNSRIFVPKMDWVRFKVQGTFHDIEGWKVKRVTIFNSGVDSFWKAAIYSTKETPVGSAAVATAMLQLNEKSLKKKDPFGNTRDLWVERLHIERETANKIRDDEASALQDLRDAEFKRSKDGMI